MQAFTTRPEIKGTFGVVASTHWIASAVGMSILEKGGNAFDAAVATGLVLQILEPHLNGPAGDMPAIIRSAASGRTEVICGQGPAPAGATIAHYRNEGLDMIPGDGLLATVVPGAFGAWMLMLRDYGRLSLRAVMEPAIHYAEKGHPALPRVAATIEGLGEFFEREWPTSHETWLPGGRAPEAHGIMTNPVLAKTLTRLLKEGEAASGREGQIEAAKDAFYKGFVAEEIDRFVRDTVAMDASGTAHRGVLTGEDMARWEPTVETPASVDYHGWSVSKTQSWGQGPVLLQALKLLEGYDLAAMDPAGADFVHTVVEAEKLAFADREAYYGDPAFVDVPLERLLSHDYAEARRALIGGEASFDLRPGIVEGYEEQVQRTLAMLDHASATGAVYEPTMAHLSEKRGDTVHIDIVDAEGNMVSTTPSGGWLQSSPVVPGLGFPLNSRAQMFWLAEGLPCSLAPGKRPRTTLTPTIAIHEEKGALGFGTPGGDQQDQWQLPFFLHHLHHGMDLQQAIDAPLFHTMHFPASFYPRSREPGAITIEASIGETTLSELRKRGHLVSEAEPWTVGRLTAVGRNAGGLLRGAATPRLMQAYAIGR
ncbi:gamma-glutamyltransferase family protein [Pararhizobium mangrovi]|uniref:Gamma-glutamyltransferase family protein n=1 Tax=Pararhizobium mangrovi TaxID=2590452 RepID=A0A506U2S7_9HYPH|nr:gamma-glutamyltransferase family protein [Pararhizobium mangrovi]TPW28672.1 gamma-glutamyltransferase family protein [Pararhizobium mangrovi]